MAVVAATGTLTAQPQTTTAAQVNVFTGTTAGVYVFETDLSAMLNGTVIELRINLTIGGTAQLAYYAVYANVQAQPIKLSVPVPVLAGDTITMTIIQTLPATPFTVTRTRALAIG